MLGKSCITVAYRKYLGWLRQLRHDEKVKQYLLAFCLTAGISRGIVIKSGVPVVKDLLAIGKHFIECERIQIASE